ncbi:3-methyl-2-oxobutanoate hydroxymethyltransferase [Chitinophaga skermanii]|uniref:3-methyl-2-oxobutanoate hydroxymethyltransferase n=1 Tax=Chitinophaga skermanii TaxID=331697 RepID=A0A327QTN1_9BACT|nr:3-methyl-2-oxobutanoate hydroxymethyltransferase [Chitinophaga skermanii]RAJ05107.1 3-methyl-2-oxobutanoate hydroxymethyltransferase [Chitinophaga skermanii]
MLQTKAITKVSTQTLLAMKARGEKIAVLTCYDYSMAKALDYAGIDILLVGDSAANVMAGFETTLPITLDHMIYHAQCVARAVERAFVLVDLPFGTYQGDPKTALSSAIRIMKETGGHGVKLEGGIEVIDSVKAIVNAGIPVMGHLGLTPQSINLFGTYALRAKSDAEAQKLLYDAQLLQDAGCFSVLLEKIPAQLGKEVSEQLSIPTISIGAGKYCDGQVLVIHDMLGLNKDFKPKFLRQYADLFGTIAHAAQSYISDVKTNDFPNEQEQY